MNAASLYRRCLEVGSKRGAVVGDGASLDPLALGAAGKPSVVGPAVAIAKLTGSWANVATLQLEWNVDEGTVSETTDPTVFTASGGAPLGNMTRWDWLVLGILRSNSLAGVVHTYLRWAGGRIRRETRQINFGATANAMRNLSFAGVWSPPGGGIMFEQVGPSLALGQTLDFEGYAFGWTVAPGQELPPPSFGGLMEVSPAALIA